MRAARQNRKPLGASSRPARRPITLASIRRLAREIADKFAPEKIILFGSYAYGTPHEDSDVDLLVVMPAWNEISKSAQISCAIKHPFPLDIIVRTPDNLAWRLKEGDWFLREIVEKGKVLYEKTDRPVGSQGRSRPKASQNNRRKKTPL